MKLQGKTILLLGAVGLGAYLLLRPRHVIGEGGRSSSVVGPSGAVYPIGIGEPSTDGRVVYSVFKPDARTVLFTYIDVAPGQPERPGARQLLAHNEQLPRDEVELAMDDFNFA
jgi:hypothetical protein